MANARCATCKHFGTFTGGDGRSLTICEREGPKLKAQAVPLGEGNIGWASNTFWMPVSADNGCGHHEVGIEVVGGRLSRNQN